MTELKHYDHGPCVACLHNYAHGLWNGYSLALVEVIKAGHVEGSSFLDDKQRRIVNREIRKRARILRVDSQELAELMRHHRADK